MTLTSAAGMDHGPALLRLVDFYQGLSPQSLLRLADIYAAGADFKDPFNEVRGLAAISGIFEHMFVQVEQPRFVVHTRILQGCEAFLTWDFEFRMKRLARGVQTVHGATHLRFDALGMVCLHRDYWDAAEELYEKLPLLGGLMRLLKRASRS